MDIHDIILFSEHSEHSDEYSWEDTIGKYEIVFSDHHIESLLQSKGYKSLLDSKYYKVLLLNDPTCIVSIGGFQAHNEGKHLAELKGLPLVTTPTQLANDSFGTNRYSITDNEQSASVESVFPVKTVFDIPFLLENGMEKSLWGIGEFIGLYFSIIDYSLKSSQTFDGLISWLVEQIHELVSIYNDGNERLILKKVAILLTVKCLVMRANGNHEIGCGIDHSFARCFEKNTSIPHGRAVYMGSLLANVLFPEGEKHGLSKQLLLNIGKMTGIKKTDIKYMQSLDILALIRDSIQIRPNRSSALESIGSEQYYRIKKAKKEIQELVWED